MGSITWSGSTPALAQHDQGSTTTATQICVLDSPHPQRATLTGTWKPGCSSGPSQGAMHPLGRQHLAPRIQARCSRS